MLVYHDRPETAAQWGDGFEAGARFFAAQAADPVITRRVSGLGAGCDALVVTRPDAPACVFSDDSLTVLLDGSPYRRGRPVGPADAAAIYRSEGPDELAASLDGAWVMAVIDEQRRCLVVANDRFGVKPVYRARSRDGAFVSSSPGALIRAGWIDGALNPRKVACYAACHYHATFGAPETFFRDIELLKPAALWEVGRAGERESTYWQLDASAPYIDDPDDQAAARFREQLIQMTQDAVDGSNEPDPMLALSGGIDSGALAGLMHTVTGRRPNALSLTYGGARYDESEFIAASVRDHVGEWHELSMGPADPLRDLPELYSRFDSPLSTVSIYAYDYLYREARDSTRTFISGAGGDQLQAGNYPYFLYNLADLKFTGSPEYEHELDCWIQHHGTAEFPKSSETAEEFFARNVDPSVPGALRSLPLPLTGLDLLTPEFRAQAGDLSRAVVPPHGSWLRSYAIQEYHYDAVPPVAEAKDVIEWSWGIGVAAPFFAREIAEFSWTLPPKLKIQDGVNKLISRIALRGICADEVLDTVAKQGFNAPFGIWLRDELRSWATDLIGPQAHVSEIYSRQRLEQVLDEHLTGQANHAMLLWQVINLELWLREWAP